MPPADIYVIGEIHDNPVHHAVQANLVARLDPEAVVFEMLSDEQAARIEPDTPRDAATLGPLLDWAESGWPDIALYAPIMAASDAVILGAAGAAGDLSVYDLDVALPVEEQAARERLQAEAHCGALPEDMLPDFVARQRATDAQFAARTLAALDAHGAPVVLIAGNGHARTDWGVPAAIARVRPELGVVAVVQGEGDPTVPGDLVLQATPQDRGDPCDAFR
ncbi:ChaN family lipoprotein [uncultured Jannaschia sp.]|uniref:ChaN family lipoprotein n=1 Tax=uncultured Jannaschia sp. TaxID=293347 RepID=UPI002608C7BB|nr:ChaN family lipoprotein [uncultured Jannaschia sp.]